jgi:hypothetical protein
MSLYFLGSGGRNYFILSSNGYSIECPSSSSATNSTSVVGTAVEMHTSLHSPFDESHTASVLKRTI